MTRILVTGSRDLTDRNMVEDAIRGQLAGERPTLVVGDCPTGADLFAYEYAVRIEIDIELFAANWDEFGKAAGPRRNKAMVDSGADICLAFLHGNPSDPTTNRGTRNCAALAKEAGIPVRYHLEVT